MDHHGAVVHERRRRVAAVALACALAATLFWSERIADAAIVATIDLGTAGNYSVLGGSTVTNTNATVLHQSLGLWPGTDITGFPPGQVVAPGTIDKTNAAAQQAQQDLTVAYVDAEGRPVDGTTTADLTDLILPGGVYSGPGKGALLLSGPLVLDGRGDASSVFIFQTDSSLTTATGSTVTLVNGAQACNVFWQVGSSATLGTGSVFVGTIMALTSITVTNGVTVHGRALARNGAVTLDGDVINDPSCATGSTSTTADPGTSTTADPTTTTTANGESTTTTADSGSGGTTTTLAAGPGGTAGGTTGGGTTAGGTGGGGTAGGGTGGGTGGGAATTATTRDRSTIPRSGSPVDDQALVALAVLGMGLIALGQRELARSDLQ